jgi:uncharacterized protein (UPF0332 family)
VTPEATRYLEKARLILEHARLMLTVNLTEDAGRSAYLAGYQAAEALIFERTGKVTKSHKGAHTEFARLTRDEPSIDHSHGATSFKRLCTAQSGSAMIVMAMGLPVAERLAFLSVRRGA